MGFDIDQNDDVTMSAADLASLVGERDALASKIADLVKVCEISLQYIEAVCFNTENPKKRKNYAEAVRIIRAAILKAGST